MYKILKEYMNSKHVLTDVGQFLTGLFMGGFCVNGYYPLATAYIAGIWMAKGNAIAAILGALFGGIIAKSPSSIVSTLILAVLCAIWSFWQGAENVRTRDKVLMVAAAQLICVIFFSFETAYDCLLGLLSTLLSVGVSFAVCGGHAAITTAIRKKRLLSPSERGALCLYAGIVTLSIGGINILSVSISVVLVCIIAMTAACSNGVFGICFAISAAIGAMLGAKNGVGFIGTVAASAFCAAILSPSGKFAVAAVYCAAQISFGVFASSSVSITETLLSAAIFIAIPKRFIQMLTAQDLQPVVKNNAESVQRRRAKHTLQTAAEVLCTVNDFAGVDSTVRRLDAVTRVLYRLTQNRVSVDPQRYRIDIGASALPKDEGDETGDCMGLLHMPNAELLLLCDGMGSGSGAYDVSKAAADIFCDLLDAGFDMEDTIEFANRSLMYQANGKEVYSTVDVLQFSTVDATAKVVKLGAPPSFIVRGSEIIAVSGESLPIGIIEETQPATFDIKLHVGDKFAMMTDGVTDALGSGLYATLSDAVSRAKDAQEAADIVIEKSRDGGVIDDMSIIFVYVEKIK